MICACLKCPCYTKKDGDSDTSGEDKKALEDQGFKFNNGLWKRSTWTTMGKSKSFFFPLSLLSRFWGMEILIPAKCPYV